MEVSQVDAIAERYGREPSALIGVLQDIQESCGYLPEDVLRRVASVFGVPEIRVFQLASFYKSFSLEPRGRHQVTVCLGTACHVRGAPRMLDAASAHLGIEPGETTGDGVFTLETVNCLGACALGPVVVLDGKYHDHMDHTKLCVLLDWCAKRTPGRRLWSPRGFSSLVADA